MQYIQRIEGMDKRTRETVDEFETRKEALEMLKEYALCDYQGTYYISQRPCKDWKE